MGKHIFISYCRENEADVGTLRDELINGGEKVWWDDDILPGQDWKLEIQKAIEAAYAVLVCFSREVEARYRSGIYPELRDAIEQYRRLAPGSSYLFPIRLSDCTIPRFTIDATHDLRDLQCIDLFPTARRAAAVQKLIKAVRGAPDRH